MIVLGECHCGRIFWLLFFTLYRYSGMGCDKKRQKMII